VSKIIGVTPAFKRSLIKIFKHQYKIVLVKENEKDSLRRELKNVSDSVNSKNAGRSTNFMYFSEDINFNEK
jgi:hypothetical protein